MRIAVIHATTQIEKNKKIFEICQKIAKRKKYEVINFGVFDHDIVYSYVEIAICIGLLLNAGVVDLVVSGCSSGQGMNLACNTQAGVLSGLIQTKMDAFLFGRINGGNVVTFPYKEEFGWQGYPHFEACLEALLDGEFGIGYPPESAERKRKDANLVKEINRLSKKDMLDFFDVLPMDLKSKVFAKKEVIEFIKQKTQKEKYRLYFEKYGS